VNIVIPTIDYPPIEGGIGTLTLELSRELATLGHDVTVIAPRIGDRIAEDKSEPVSVVRFRGYGLGWLRFFPLLIAARPHLRNADIILGINVAYGGIIGLLSRKPYLVFAYAYEFLKFRDTRWVANLLRRVYRNATGIVAISQYTREQLMAFGAPEDRINICYPGATLPESVPDDAVRTIRRRQVLGDGPIILSVGRLIARKNQIALIEAMPAILKRHPEAMLVLAGRGPMLSPIARRAGELGIRDHVALPGKVSDGELDALYEATTVFALPCKDEGDGHVEGFGLVFVEAGAHGKPVVAGRGGGVEDAVVDGETGLLVDPDDGDAIAEALLRFLDDSEFAARVGAAGRARVERELNWNIFAANIAELCENLR
jgi:phosphatidylinositol alpha-1,6-mannosyltransferase